MKALTIVLGFSMLLNGLFGFKIVQLSLEKHRTQRQLEIAELVNRLRSVALSDCRRTQLEPRPLRVNEGETKPKGEPR